ncbi:MAG: hypothetical protein AB1450_04905 [Pseudomonadota bacterium]
MFDSTLPFRTRDGRPVMVFGRRHGLIMGAIPNGNGGYEATCWGEESGLRVDTFGATGSDLENYQPVYADAYLEHWGNVFVSHRLHDMGIRFDMFIRCPQDILEAVERHYAADRVMLGDHDDLLPAQRAVMPLTTYDTDALLPGDAELRGEHYVQPLHHHSHAACGHRAKKVAV